MKKYKVIGIKTVKSVDGNEETSFSKIKDDNGVFWDPGSFVTTKQISDKNAETMIKEGLLEFIEEINE